MLNKKQLSERDICTKFITPAIEQAGWDIKRQIREEYTFTDGRVIVRGKNLVTRGKKKRADYVLFYKSNIPIAIIEAKDNTRAVGDGMQQALEYSEILDIPFVFSSNGEAFQFHDKTITEGTIEKELNINSFPSPDELWQKYKAYKGITIEEAERIVTQEYHIDTSGKEPRYYQRIAINRTIEAIAKGQNRILLVMATGTGKTYTAFQIIWRLWKARIKKRILFLADRNMLVDQTKNNDFAPFGDIMTKISNRKIDKAYEIYLALYQGVSGTEEIKNVYKQFSKDFFDLIVVDECHRGSAADDSAWREILEYFSSATQIGLTATPKETKYVSNIHYFGKPIYTYSLKQGIEDGFLAPYKVIRPIINVDIDGYTPEEGKLDKYGNSIEQREYNTKDFDKNLVIEPRTQLVAKRVTEFLKTNDRFAKTIVFCIDTEHAARMRQALINENTDLVNQCSKYVMRITGNDEEGKLEFDNFKDPEAIYPVIATTSKLLTTGVDTKTCKLIVLDSNINSMTEFKQIIGRGTRLSEDYNKMFFTIMDFRNATKLFEDPEFDGEPVQIYEPEQNDPIDIEIGEDETTIQSEAGISEPIPPEQISGDPKEPQRKYYVNDIEVVQIGERKMYYGKDGKLITESLIDFTKENVQKEYASLDYFIKKWNSTDRKQAIIEELAEHGVMFEELKEEVSKKLGMELDSFDLICHVAFDMPPLTRQERANNVKKRNYFGKYKNKARLVLEALLDKYTNEGIESIEDPKILSIQPFNGFGTPLEIINTFGGLDKFKEALLELEQQLYGVG
ncbi:MAG TPA: DEAD/DEAH box helicase family protein [Candidatus Gastranaerophilales bacterium]|nr:DEAD/DEAH box helicase family protein [Candidatus Gastranaerophilales bacterium]